jgi:hypothetical protein
MVNALNYEHIPLRHSPRCVELESQHLDSYRKPFTCQNLPFGRQIRPMPDRPCVKQPLRLKSKYD